MNKVVAGGILAIVLLCSGLALYVFTGQSSHQKVIDKFTITDESRGRQLTPELVESKTKGWYSLAELTLDFRQGSSYTQSFWKWTNPAGDVDYTMTIWGPDETGSGYYVELGRMCGFQMKIIYSGEPAIEPIVFDEVTDFGNFEQPGYTPLEVTVD